MKRTIILIRHGKACDHAKFKRDIDRVLTERGVNDAYKVGSKLIQNGYRPDLILSSPAARASHTALILGRQMNLNSEEIKMKNILYHCSSTTILDEILCLPDEISTIAIAAHNPGITDLAYELSSGGTNFLPTTGVAVINYDIEKWSEITNIRPKDFFFILPREINAD